MYKQNSNDPRLVFRAGWREQYVGDRGKRRRKKEEGKKENETYDH